MAIGENNAGEQDTTHSKICLRDPSVIIFYYCVMAQRAIKASGIDISIFKAHSVRGEGVSATSKLGVCPYSRILCATD